MKLLQLIISTILWQIGAAVVGKSLSSLSCGTYSSDAEALPPRHGRIVGGTDALPGEIPFIASLTRRGGHFCGATILNDQWLLTAAHCVCNGFDKILRANQIKAVLGLYKISEFKKSNTALDNDNGVANEQDFPEERAFEVGLKSIVAHPQYKCREPDNDIALLELSQPITFSESVKPICIAVAATKHNNTYDGESALISGWGFTHENHEIGTRPDTLQKALVDVWSNQKCQKSFQDQKKSHVINRTQMCAGKTTGGVDSCWADSGGPLVSKGNVLIGVVSTGIGCGRKGLPGIYTRVTEYSDWIEETMALSQ